MKSKTIHCGGDKAEIKASDGGFTLECHRTFKTFEAADLAARGFLGLENGGWHREKVTTVDFHPEEWADGEVVVSIVTPTLSIGAGSVEWRYCDTPYVPIQS